MVKTYLRYEHKAAFGVISSYRSNVLFAGGSIHTCVAASLEDAALWNLRQGARVGVLREEGRGGGSGGVAAEESSEITAISQSIAAKLISVGKSDGSVLLFRRDGEGEGEGEHKVTLQGHKKDVGALAFNADGSRLVSGSRDTDVILWDVISETGLFRLRGHKDEVTGAAFVQRNGADLLVSSSKDTLIKVWDLTTQHCVQTCVGHRSEVWSIALDPFERRLISGASDNQLRIWAVDPHTAANTDAHADASEVVQPAGDEEPGLIGATATLTTATAAAADGLLRLLGILTRATPGRTVQVKFSADGRLFGCLGAGQAVELYTVCTAKQVDRKVKRRLKRWREKHRKNGSATEKAESTALMQPPSSTPLAADEFDALTVLRSSHKTKVRSFDLAPHAASGANGADDTVAVLLGLYNNSLEVHHVSSDAEEPPVRRSVVSQPGHRSDIRGLALSSDDAMLLSCSSGAAKVWNVSTMQCVTTLPIADNGVALCGCFLPGNRHIVVGTKEGKMQLFELASGACIAEYSSHDGAVWSLALRPDNRGLASASADHTVKFWSFDLVEVETDAIDTSGTEQQRRRQLGLVHNRTLKMTDDVLCVRFSHNARGDKLLVAVSLMDNTVKIFFDNSLKFFLSLYGHKLPVMCLDISTDNTLLVTASADKNVKLWGLDFGDCHASLFAHADSVMGVAFVPRTHHFFTVGKDCLVKYWDGDAREQVMALDMHRGEVWCLVVSSLGDFVATGSHDRSVRLWHRTNEQLFLEEEKEKGLEKEFDKLRESGETTDADGNGMGVADSDDGKVAAAGRATATTLLWSERLAEALDLVRNEIEQHDAWRAEEARAEKALSPSKLAARHAARAAANRSSTCSDSAECAAGLPSPLVVPPPANILLMGRTALQHVEFTLRGIKPDELEQALITLPFASIALLLQFSSELLSSGSGAVELVARCVTFVLRQYHDQIVANRMLRSTLDKLRMRLRGQLQAERDAIGFNLAGLQSLKRRFEGRHFDEDSSNMGVLNAMQQVKRTKKQ